ncbi:head GIN domain-containing protein [Rufibacter psychrotolerans]|uniref:head GIN domain-containing protein n=1 Tax=Rufibacter psychrotolerans TaxID=2812556 RepID=UPI001967477E|nr:head GIN domain-containing protein [Rufibacter sp. SYSU D00308]
MKKQNFYSMVAILAFLVSLTSFRAAESASRPDEQTRNVGPFKKIGLAYPADVVLRQGNTHSVKVEGDADQLEQLITEVENDRLSIRRKDRDKEINWNNGKKRVTIYITAPTIEGLAVSGSGKIKGEGTFKASSLDLAVSGSGSIQLNARVDEVSSRISGSGSIELEGEGKQSTVSISGSGSLKGYNFKTSASQVSISGSGTSEVNATTSLKTSISGSGRVFYEGTPSVDSRVSGSGSVKKRG